MIERKNSVELTCFTCKEDKEVFMTDQEFEDYIGGKMLIQQALPDHSLDDRELLITQTCGPCFDKIHCHPED